MTADWSSRVSLVLLISFLPTVEIQAELCQPRWSDLFTGGEIDRQVNAFAVFDDDGDGPNPAALIIGGRFTSVGGVPANGIVKWDGSSWSTLGNGVNGPGGFAFVDFLLVFDDDGVGPKTPMLYVGGEFDMAGDVPANHIARWDGTTWAALGSGTDDRVLSLAVFDPDGVGSSPPSLYAAGNFDIAGGIAASKIAKWDGASWAEVSGGIGSGGVSAMATFDEDGTGSGSPALFVGGLFSMAGGTSVSGIAKWDGVTWSPVGTGVNGSVQSLQVFDEDGPGPTVAALFIGGAFSLAGEITVNNITKWDGATLSPVGGGFTSVLSSSVRDFAIFDSDGAGPNLPELIAGGKFSKAGGNFVFNMAKWNGSSWSDVGNGVNSGGTVLALSVFDEDASGPADPLLYVGGAFSIVGGIDVGNIAVWDGDNWAAVGEGTNDSVFTLRAVDEDGAGPDPPVIYAGGSFTTTGKNAVRKIARWDGTSWSPLGSGVTSSGDDIHAILHFDPDGAGPLQAELVAGGRFDRIGQVSTSNVAKWDGVRWSELDGGTGVVMAMEVFDEDGTGPDPAALFAAGSTIRRWDGFAWSSLGSGANRTIWALAVYDPDGSGPNASNLVAGGTFTTVDEVPANRVARWDGLSWTALGGGITGSSSPTEVRALTVVDWDDDGPQPSILYAGGRFDMADGVAATNIAQWDGTSWAALGDGVNGTVLALAKFDDDGVGPRPPLLYVGGSFTDAAGAPATYVATWDGANWSAVDTGTDNSVWEFAAIESEDAIDVPVLYMGGSFTLAGGESSSHIAALFGCPALGDLNCDGDLNGHDVDAFVRAVLDPQDYASMFPDCDVARGDFNGDNSTNHLDVASMADCLARP